MSDKEILERLNRGDDTALAQLYKQHLRMICGLITKNGGDLDDAKDIFQDALIVVWEKARAGNLVLTSRFGTFLYSICQNMWLKELNRRSKNNGQMVDRQEEESSFENDRAALINQCIQAMGDVCQQILMLYYFDKLSMQEIAKRLNLANADVAKSKKYKCKQELDNKVRKAFAENDLLEK